MAALGSYIPAFRQSAAFIGLPKMKNLPMGRPLRSRSYRNYELCPKLRTMATLSSKTGDESTVRPLAHFVHDASWDDIFFDYTPEDEIIYKKKEKEHGLLKDEFERELMKKREEPIQFLKLVDVIERLGVGYQFEDLIDESMKQIYEGIQSNNDLDLYHTSLMFRLFRQHRHDVKSNVFERFISNQGNFPDSLKKDPITMLCLYEAGYVKAQGEDILEKALEFTKFHLKVIVDSQPNHPLAPQITRALRYPIQRGVIRLESRHYISFYENNPRHSKSLLRFAKLDFDLLQSLYKEELKEITRWSKKLDLAKRFSFARHVTVQSHFFSLAMLYEPKLSLARKIYSKVTIILTIMDDIYDAFGTTEELEALTDVMAKWDKDHIDGQLPSCIKEFLDVIYDIIKECEDDLNIVGRTNYVDHLIREVIDLSKEYLHHAHWREAKYVPPYEEYIESGIKTGASLTSLMSLLVNDVEENVARRTFDIVSNNEHPQRAASIIARCLNDIASYEFDKQREHVAGAVDCYMNQYGVSKDEACVALHEIIEDEWKVLDEEMFRPKTDIPMPLLTRIFNCCRACNYVYKYENAFALSSQRMNATYSLVYIEPV